jgi:hypothetical protein
MKHLQFGKQNVLNHWIFQGSATTENKYSETSRSVFTDYLISHEQIISK